MPAWSKIGLPEKFFKSADRTDEWPFVNQLNCTVVQKYFFPKCDQGWALASVCVHLVHRPGNWLLVHQSNAQMQAKCAHMAPVVVMILDGSQSG